jgi:hypothetical protein
LVRSIGSVDALGHYTRDANSSRNENIKPADYSISYKALNSRGLSSELEDKLDFKEFIEDYKKVTAANKKMGVMVVIDNSTDKETKLSEKRSKVRKLQLLYLIILHIQHSNLM